jgi:spore maturation protein SpmA
MNGLFLALIVTAFAYAGVEQVMGSGGDSGAMARLAKAIVDEAAAAVTLAIGLAGIMGFFLGVMKVGEAGGLLRALSRLLQPLMGRLFPEIPAAHPASGSMAMNVSANILGLGNAATPFGLRAMAALDTLNPVKGTATDAMVLFLAINTANVTLLPANVIAMRAAAGSADPAGVIATTLFATLVSTVFAIVAARTGSRLWPAGAANAMTVRDTAAPAEAALPLPDVPLPVPDAGAESIVPPPYPLWVGLTAIAAVTALASLTVIHGRLISPWLLPGIVVALLLFGAIRRVPVYETFVAGARDGFRLAVAIIPYLMAILVAIGMLRSSGALAALVEPVSRVTAPLGLPAEALIMGVLRSLSGSGAYGYLASVLNDPAIGPDSYTGYLVSTIQGSTETTFYVLAVYCGSVGVVRLRHAVMVGVLADGIGVLGAVAACQLLVGR